MEQLFIGVLNNAITVSALIVAVVVVRAFGKKCEETSFGSLGIHFNRN